MVTKKPLSDAPIVMLFRGPIIPAQRPRVEEGQARYPVDYAKWQKTFKAALMAAVASLPASVSRHFPLEGVKIEIEFHGCARGNSDLDNLYKGVIDRMVKCGIITGDSVRKVNEGNPKWFEAEYAVMAVLIYPNWKPVSKINPALLQPPPGDRPVNPSNGNKRKKDPVKRGLLSKQVNSVLKKGK